jgi:integrase
MSEPKVLIQVSTAEFKRRKYDALGGGLYRRADKTFWERPTLNGRRTIRKLAARTEALARAELARNRSDQILARKQLATDPYVRSNPLAELTIGQLTERWENFKRSDTTLARKTLIEIRSYARWIRNTFGQLKPADLDKHRTELTLRALPVTNNTRRKYLRFLRMFATWLRHEALITADPFEGIRFKPDDFHAAFYTVDQIRLLLRHLVEHAPDLLGYYALLIFAGLRPSEGTRVKWEDINFATRELYVRKGKTNARHITLEPVALEWLAWHRRNIPDGRPFLEIINLENREKQIRAAALQRDWIQDGLRHGFGTFYRAKIKDIGRVADYMGNSPNIVKRHYARTVPKADCDRFWNLNPPDVITAQIQLELGL